MVDEPVTLAFDVFWNWLLAHPNCILRAGSPEAVLYDDDDLHWHFASEGPTTMVVQVIRGKRVLGELFVESDSISYVQGAPGDVEGEYTFELIAEDDRERLAVAVFVLAHGYDPEGTEERRTQRVH